MDTEARELVHTLWWVTLLRGLVAVSFGLAALFWPGLTLVTLVYLFAAFIVASGAVNLVFGFAAIGRHGSFWLLTVILAIIEIGVGVYAIRNPTMTFSLLILLVGFTFLIRGILEIVAAFMETPPDNANRALLIITGVLGILAGIFTLRSPVSAGVAFVWVLGIYGLIAGPMMIARATAAKHLVDRATDVRTA
jgi:uncharacterized membrane protein HdeD (DUF308 family)